VDGYARQFDQATNGVLMNLIAAANLITGEGAVVEPIYLHLPVTDPEIVAAFAEASDGRDRQELALAALPIGILSTKAARGAVDGATIRQQGDQLAEMDGAIEAIRKQIAGFEEIKTSAQTKVGSGEKILNRARLMEEEIAKRLSALTSQRDRVRATTTEGQG